VFIVSPGGFCVKTVCANSIVLNSLNAYDMRVKVLRSWSVGFKEMVIIDMLKL